MKFSLYKILLFFLVCVAFVPEYKLRHLALLGVLILGALILLQQSESMFIHYEMIDAVLLYLLMIITFFNLTPILWGASPTDVFKFSILICMLFIYMYAVIQFGYKKLGFLISILVGFTTVICLLNIAAHVFDFYFLAKVDYSQRGDVLPGIPFPSPRHAAVLKGFTEFGAAIIFLTPYILLGKNTFYKLVVLVIFFYALYLTGSRAVYIGLFICIYLSIVHKYGLSKKIFLALPILMFSVFFGKMVYEFDVSSLGSTVDIRMLGYVEAIGDVIRSPIWGYGDGTWEAGKGGSIYDLDYIDYISLHSVVIMWAYNSGVIPVTLVLILVGILLRNIFRHGSELSKLLAIGYIGAVFPFLWSTALLSYYLFLMTGVLIACWKFDLVNLSFRKRVVKGALKLGLDIKNFREEG